MLYKLRFRSRWSLGDMDISHVFLANDSCDECTKTLPYHTDSLGWSSSWWKKSCTTLIKPCKSWDNLPTLSPYLDFWTKNNAYPPKVIYITSLSSLLALKCPKDIQPLSNKYNWCFLVTKNDLANISCYMDIGLIQNSGIPKDNWVKHHLRGVCHSFRVSLMENLGYHEFG